jgi:uncharacterized protein YndB with AHSA1/START domain
MHLFTRTIWIAKPPETVFDFFVDFDQAPRWRRFVRSMGLGTGSLGPGGVVHVTMDLAGRDYLVDLSILACERPSLWRHETHEADYRGLVEYRFVPEGAGTRVTMTFDATPVGLYGWLGVPLLLLRRGRSYREQLPSLKRALE